VISRAYAYHAARPADRDSIRAHGLRPGSWASRGEPGVYMYTPFVYAQGYQTDEPIDVWEVDITGLTVHPDPEDPSIAIYSLDPIPADRLRFDGCYLELEELEAPEPAA
jgi:hypothetical protein